MEKAVLNVKELNVTQGMNGSYSHKGDLAIDIGKACSYLKAPFTGKVKRIYSNCNGVWLESTEKVKYADGTEDYMTVMTLHDNDVSNLKVGQIVKQGQVYYQPGTKGKVTGSHIHIAVGKGKFTGNGWAKNSYGNWCINNQYDITKALFVHTDVKQTSPMYDWKETSDYVCSNTKYLNLEPTVTAWTTYKTNKYYQPLRLTDVAGKVKPKKFGGLTYKILEDMGNYHFKIRTDSYGIVYISGNPIYDCTITDKPLYENGNY